MDEPCKRTLLHSGKRYKASGQDDKVGFDGKDCSMQGSRWRLNVQVMNAECSIGISHTTLSFFHDIENHILQRPILHVLKESFTSNVFPGTVHIYTIRLQMQKMVQADVIKQIMHS